ncbi:uncharacterized protein LOC111807430 [Cucurbita pepo subsp. pepo]|uniref:uncharacterized protein LOC111807430 n=1 Tax=Cucurbita pepo subsp. pepo TaxID=3664 RepID=UPI000C9D2ED7|nr:uncharacterized protein LOC111807430 [Cucurbita pepo subsp. pepo]XP_023548930.1 uncharacterized protein LOC111807430 [Cucurbita pepo subsp. pepo]XP_023548931.1 uncharacterized protein LOC111807430 [Cucurbita pepo subsp. pepo]
MDTTQEKQEENVESCVEESIVESRKNDRKGKRIVEEKAERLKKVEDKRAKCCVGNAISLALRSYLKLKDVDIKIEEGIKYMVERKHKEAAPITRGFSSIETELNCLDGITETTKLEREKNLLLILKRFQSPDGSHSIILVAGRLRLKILSTDYFCLFRVLVRKILLTIWGLIEG